MDYRYLVVTDHALQQFQQHDPDATLLTLARALRDGIDLDEDLARPFRGLIGKRKTSQVTYYVLAPSRRGMFAVIEEGGKKVVITYLRFGAQQENLAWDFWPGV